MRLYCVGGPYDGRTYEAHGDVKEPSTVHWGGYSYRYRPLTLWQGPRCIVGTCHLAVYTETELEPEPEELRLAIGRAIEAECVTWN